MEELDPLEYIAIILNDKERDLVRKFVDNDKMREAVRKVILAGLYHQGVLEPGKKPMTNRNFAINKLSNNPNMTNEETGAEIKISWKAISLLEMAFSDMSILKTPEPSEEKLNPAR